MEGLQFYDVDDNLLMMQLCHNLTDVPASGIFIATIKSLVKDPGMSNKDRISLLKLFEVRTYTMTRKRSYM